MTLVTSLPRRHLLLLQAGSLTSTVDRFVVGPLLLAIASTYSVSLTAAAPVAGVYFLLYGAAQPVWGLCSDRFGRVPTMRLTLLLACLTGTASVFAPTLTTLIVARGVTGACMSAVVPTGLVYVGDAVHFASRQRTVTDLNAATAIGITAATALGGVLAATVSWRAAFLLPALSAGVLGLTLRALPEPERPVRRRWAVLHGLTGSWWPAVVLTLAFVEGGALLGPLAYFPPVLESGGLSTSAAGALASVYGLGLLVASRVVKRVVRTTPAAHLLAVGAAVLVTAYLLVVVSRAPALVGCAALLVGVGWACMHSTMQSWATEVMPGARAMMVALFSGALFAASGVVTSLLAPLGGAQRWAALYGVGLALAVVFAVLAAPARSAFGRRVAHPS